LEVREEDIQQLLQPDLPFVTEFATRFARLRKLRANPLRGTGGADIMRMRS